MRRIRTALIGVNTHSHSPQAIRALKKQTDNFEFVGYCLPEGERERLPNKLTNLEDIPELTLEQILEDPTIEAVVIETDEIYLSKYALLAAKAGKHIQMEKPGGADAAEFEEMIETVRKNGTVFHTGYMYRYNPYVTELLERIDKGELGEILYVEAQMNCHQADWVRHWLNCLPAGMMFFLGCHMVDLIYRIQGMPQRVVPMNKRTGADGIDSPDFGLAMLEYPNGVSFAKTTAVEYGGFHRRQLVVVGTKGTVELRPLEWGKDLEMRTTRNSFDDTVTWGTPPVVSTSEPFDRYDNMLADFVAMVRGEKENPYTLDYELQLHKLVLQCCGVN